MLTVWVVYERPIPCSDWYVARKDVAGVAWPERPHQMIFDRRLHRLRERFMEEGLARLERMPGDDPNILEVWL